MAYPNDVVNAVDSSQIPGMALTDGTTALSLLQQVSDDDSARSSVWMFSYIDLLTLLLSLFVILLAFQQKDPALTTQPKIIPEAPSATAQQAPSVTPTRSLKRPISAAELADLSLPALDPATVAVNEQHTDHWVTKPLAETKELSVWLEIPDPTAPLVADLAAIEFDPSEIKREPAPDANTAAESSTEHRMEAAATTPPQLAQLDERITTSRQPDKVQLEVRDSILFAPARSQLKQDGMLILDQLAELFKQHQGSIAIQGHTDDRPINNAEFASNWELSSTRASRVARYLIDRGVNAESLQVVGFADTKPLASNALPEGRAQNRRVSFIMYTPGHTL